jgi:hypothetical protein
MCKDIKTKIINDKCKTESNIFNNPLCKDYCKNKPADCIQVANEYCSNNMDKEECNIYCKKNPKNCIPSIKKHCVNDNIINPFCLSILSTPELAGQHDEEMEKYCNNSPNKTNSICNCKNNEVIKDNFKTIIDESVKNVLIKRPDCYYRPCAILQDVYKLEEKLCPNITVCKSDLSKMHANNICQGLQVNNCIKIDKNCNNSNIDDSKSNSDLDEYDIDLDEYNIDKHVSSSNKKSNMLDTVINIFSIPSLSHNQNMYLQISSIGCCCCCCCLLLLIIIFKKK